MARSQLRSPQKAAPQAPKVLVVNADSDKVRRMGAAVRAAGFMAVEASSFADAKHLFASEFPQALIVDVRLGAFNGLQLLIRARMIRSEIPVMVTSDIPDRVLELEAKRFGASFVTGPVEMRTFLSSIPVPMWDPFPSHLSGIDTFDLDSPPARRTDKPKGLSPQ